MQRSFVLKLGASLVVFGIIGFIAIFGYYKFTGRGGSSEYGASKSKDELMKEYLNYASMGDNYKAFRSIMAATRKEPENIPLLKKAADAAIKAGKKSEANALLEQVWASGVRDPKVLFTLVSTSILPKFEQRKRTLELISQINQESLRQKLYALYYFQLEKYEKAQGYFKWLVENDPHPAIYEYYARNYLAMRMPQRAVNVLQEAEKKGFLGNGGEIILANLYAVEGKLEAEDKLYQSYVQVNGQSDFVILSHAIILFANNRMTAAGEFLEKICHPSRFAASNVVSPEDIIEKLNTDPALKPLLERLSPRTRKVINADKNDIFEISLFSELLAQDFNRIALADSADSEEFLRELSKLHKLFDAELSALGSNTTAHQARLFLAPILYMRQDKFGLENLLLFASGSDRFYEGERNYIQYYIEMLGKKKDASKKLSAAEEILGKKSVMLLAQAQDDSLHKDYNSAIKNFSLAARQNKTIGSGSYLLENLAQALAADGKYLACFELIRRMHNKRMISKTTLMLLRDVAYPAGFPEISNGAQKVLEKKYGTTDDIMLGKAELSLREGNAQAALDLFEKLLAKGVEPTYEARVNSVMAEAMLQLQMFQGVLDIVDEKEIDPTYKARALYGLGEHDKALGVFDKVQGTPADKGQWRVEYGLLLALKGREEEAAVQFQKAIDDNPKLLRAYVELASILLKHKQYLQAKIIAEMALEISPEMIRAKMIVANVNILEGNNASAEILLNDVLRKYPANIDALFLKSRSLLNQGQKEDALSVIDRCLQLKPSYPLFLQQKLDILVSMDRLADAEKIAGLGIETNVDKALFEHARVMLLLQQKKTSQAYEALEQSQDISQSDKLILESEILDAEGQTAKAITRLKSFATSPKIEFRLVELVIREENPAQSNLEYVINNIKDGTFKFPVQTLLVLGMMADEEKKYDLAATLYAKGLEQEPEEMHLLNNYIWASLNSDKPVKEKILPEVAKALKLYPDNTVILDTCTTAYNKYNDYDKTIEVLRKNPALFRLEPSLYLRLGDAWKGKAVQIEAKKFYEKALKAERSSDEIRREAQARLDNIR